MRWFIDENGLPRCSNFMRDSKVLVDSGVLDPILDLDLTLPPRHASNPYQSSENLRDYIWSQESNPLHSFNLEPDGCGSKYQSQRQQQPQHRPWTPLKNLFKVQFQKTQGPDHNFRAPEHHPLRIGSNSQIQEGIGEIMNIQIAPDEERMSPDSVLRDLADTDYLQDNMIQAQRAIEAGYICRQQEIDITINMAEGKNKKGRKRKEPTDTQNSGPKKRT